jgi:DNA-binding NtrC family response regulator
MAKEPVLKTPLIGIEADRKRQESVFVVPDNLSFSELEKEILSQLLSRYEGNRTITAEKLGISRRTIQRKIKEHNLPF